MTPSIKHILVLLITFILSPVAALDAADKRPNVILFLIDDQDKTSIGAYGGKTFTPNLDGMAAEGMKFSRAYVASAVCTPSRYAWVTGRYAGNSTSKLFNEACGGADKQGFPNFNMALEPERMNIGNVFIRRTWRRPTIITTPSGPSRRPWSSWRRTKSVLSTYTSAPRCSTAALGRGASRWTSHSFPAKANK
jgi:hypothetical protein